MNNSRKTMVLVVALLCAITLLACDLGGGQQPPPSGGQQLATPSNLRVTSTTRTVAHIAWDDKSSNEDGFEIEFPGKQNPKTSPNETQWEITGLECGKAYNFRVRTFNAAGNSQWSNQVTAQTLACDSGGQQPPPPAGKPDLVIQDLTVKSGPRPDGGSGVEVEVTKWTVVNRGDVRASPSKAHLIQKWQAGQTTISICEVPTLSPGESYVCEPHRLFALTQPGIYSLSVIADAEQTLAESNEENNTQKKDITVK